MDKPFNEQQEAFLKQLNEKPIWVSITNSMKTFSTMPRYRTGKPIDKQTADWMFESGRITERETILSLLTVSKTKMNLEK